MAAQKPGDGQRMEQQYSRLVEALQLVAADSEAQLNALPDGVDKPNEVALLYEEVFLLSDHFLRGGRSTPGQHAKLKEIEDLFSRMDDRGPDLWTHRMMRVAPEWENARVLARETLGLLGERVREPDPWWVTSKVYPVGIRGRVHWLLSAGRRRRRQ